MCGGGLFDRSLVLLSGPTGTGKSMLSAQFIAAGAANGERSLLFSFEESRDQLERNAEAWGIDFRRFEEQGLLRVVAAVPEGATLEDHLLHLRSEIAEFAPDRIALDSLTALQRVATARSFREYLLGLSFHIKTAAVIGLVTATADDLGGGLSTGALHMSTVADTVILLQYVGRRAQIDRGVTVLKMRGSDHDKALRQFTIDGGGMHIGEPLELREWTQLPQVL
jgi:circadian clock protein KaiC